MTFDYLNSGAPVVVGVKDAVAALVHSWQCLDVNDIGQFADAVRARIAAGPVLIVPPWDEPRSPLPSSGVQGGRVLRPEAVLLQCRPAGPASVMAAVMPESTFISERARTVRESLAEYWQPIVLLYATGVIPDAHPAFGTAVSFFQARQHVAPVLRIFRVPEKADPGAVKEDFQQLLVQRRDRGQFGYAISYPLPPGEGLRFERHDPAVLAKRADLHGYGGVVPLGQLFEVVVTGILLAQSQVLSCEAGDDGAVRVLGGRDITRDGTIAPPDDRSPWAQVPSDGQLRPGDLLVREIYHPTDHGGLIVAEVTADDLPATADHRVVVLRPREVLDAQHRLFATLFLRSPLARALTLGAGGMHLLKADLRDLDLPLPDEALSAALDHVTEAEERLETWRREAEGLLQSAFLDDSAASARRRIVIAGRKLRLRVEEAAFVDDFGHFVRTRFPYPIALRWRRVQAYSGGDESGLAYREILDTAEILLSYSALLGMAISWEQGITLGAVAGIRRRLTSGRGPGLGDWRALLNEIGHHREIQRLPTNHPLHDLGSLMTNPDIAAARNRLNNRRNDEAHQRHVDPVDMPLAIAEATVDLTALVEQAQFLADWPLVYIEATRWDTFRGTTTIRYRQLMGDHAIVPHQITERHSNDLEQGSLYIIDSENGWHLLRPFLIGRGCPECKSWSTFHVDRDDQGDLVIKSLEHGHTDKADWLTEPLGYVGLL